MARTRLVDAPPRNDVYVGMLAVSALATLVGIAVLVLELSGDYGFEAEAKGLSSANIPKDFSRPAPKSDGSTPAPTPMTRAEEPVPPPAVATAPPREPETPAPVLPPAAVVTMPAPLPVPDEAPVPTAAPPVVPTVPADPSIVRPGFVPRMPRR